jgi:hypothetical protein
MFGGRRLGAGTGAVGTVALASGSVAQAGVVTRPTNRSIFRSIVWASSDGWVVGVEVGRAPNRHREITTDLKRPLCCGVTRAVRLPRRT